MLGLSSVSNLPPLPCGQHAPVNMPGLTPRVKAVRTMASRGRCAEWLPNPDADHKRTTKNRQPDFGLQAARDSGHGVLASMTAGRMKVLLVTWARHAQRSSVPGHRRVARTRRTAHRRAHGYCTQGGQQRPLHRTVRWPLGADRGEEGKCRALRRLMPAITCTVPTPSGACRGRRR